MFVVAPAFDAIALRIYSLLNKHSKSAGDDGQVQQLL